MEIKKIAKFRDGINKDRWYLTNFTMSQVEGRLSYLEKIFQSGYTVIVGRDIIELLADNSQYKNKNVYLIAGSCLYGKNPYKKIGLLQNKIYKKNQKISNMRIAIIRLLQLEKNNTIDDTSKYKIIKSAENIIK